MADDTTQSIDRIRRVRAKGADLMDTLDKWSDAFNAPPPPTPTQQYEPEATNVPNQLWGPRYEEYPGQEQHTMYRGKGLDAAVDGKDSPISQHQWLGDVHQGDETVEMGIPKDNRDLKLDEQERVETGLARGADWVQAGGMTRGQRHAAVRAKSDQEHQTWLANQEQEMAKAEAQRQGIKDQQATQKREADAAAWEERAEANLDSALNPQVPAPVDPIQREADDDAKRENRKTREFWDAELAKMDLPVEAEPTDAPLPGEETLPPVVAAWAQNRAGRGMGGVGALRAAYEKEIPEDARVGGIHTFEHWLWKKGVRPDMKLAEAMPILNKLSPMDAQHTDRRRDQFIEQFAARHAEQMAKAGINQEQLRSIYEAGSRSDPNGDPILGGARAVNAALAGRFKADKAMQTRVAVNKRADQFNRARSFGVPQGTVQFFDSLQAAQTPQERANILMLAHASQPRMGWDKMAAMLMKGEIDNDAMGKWAGQMGGKPQGGGIDKIGQDANAVALGWDDPGFEAQATAMAKTVLGGEAKPEAIAGFAKDLFVKGAREAILSGKPLTPAQVAQARKYMNSESLESFAAQIGLQATDPRLAQLYYRIFGKAPNAGWLANAVRNVGNALGSVGRFASGATVQAPPQAWAGAPATVPSHPSAASD